MLKSNWSKIIFLIIILSVTTLAQTYYVTESGKKFHKQSCRFVSASGIAIELKNAISRGYEPCGICKPGGEALSHDFYQWKAKQDTVGSVSGEKTKVEKRQCKGITQKGKRCKNKAQEDSDYCWQHSK
jgi:hypothetical protein